MRRSERTTGAGQRYISAAASQNSTRRRRLQMFVRLRLLRCAPRLSTHSDEPLCIGTILIPTQSPIKYDADESCVLHPLPEFLAGIDRVMKRETPCSAFPQDDPFVPNAGPIVKDFMSLYYLGTVG